MEVNYSNSVHLLQDAEQKSLYPNLVAQIKKDFGLANIDVDIPETIDALGLCQVLREKVYYLIMEKFPQYLNLLYVVDVPERLFKQIQVTDVVEVAEQVSFLILRREMQKVLLKRRYS